MIICRINISLYRGEPRTLFASPCVYVGQMFLKQSCARFFGDFRHHPPRRECEERGTSRKRPHERRKLQERSRMWRGKKISARRGGGENRQPVKPCAEPDRTQPRSIRNLFLIRPTQNCRLPLGARRRLSLFNISLATQFKKKKKTKRKQRRRRRRGEECRDKQKQIRPN